MGGFDWLAGYGALLATVLAIFQFIQWHSASKPLKFSIFDADEYGKSSRFEATITNVSSHTIYVEGAWIGISYRSWRKPWRRTLFEGDTLKSINGDFHDKKSAEGILAPGSIMLVHSFDLEAEPKWKKAPMARGLRNKRSICIEHSLSDSPFIKVLS